MARKPLFPFYITGAARLARQDFEYERALEKEGRFANITNLRVDGKVEGVVGGTGTLSLNAWAATDNGFCQTAGTFWKKTIELSKEQLQRYVEIELESRAAEELEKEAADEFNARVNARAQDIMKELGL